MQTARETTVPLPRRPMLHALAKFWWLLLLRGIAANPRVGRNPALIISGLIWIAALPWA
jgi:hypothetical protein